MIKYCPQIKNLSEKTWDYLSDVFSYNLKASEIGFTNHLIFDIVSFYKGKPKSCEVYSIHAKNEHKRGADIDLFIQNKNGTYQFYMLQAKRMDYNGKYIDIAKWGARSQYYKLIKASNKEKATALYLFYNGNTKNSVSGSPPFGMSIIAAEEIRSLRLSQFKCGYKPNQHVLHFDMLYHKNMCPFSSLFCIDKTSLKLSLSGEIPHNEIYTDFPYLQIDLTEDSAFGNNSDNEVNMETPELKERNLARYRVILKNEE